MRSFVLTRTIELPGSPEQVFPFFSEAQNLELLTPPWLRFRILTPLPIAMGEGTLIDYALSWHGLPVRWRSEITAWEPPFAFVDRQVRGPYRRWVHTHTFRDLGGRTLVRDHVVYSVWGGRLVQRLVVGPDLERVFDHRTSVLRELLGGAEHPGSSASLQQPRPTYAGAQSCQA